MNFLLIKLPTETGWNQALRKRIREVPMLNLSTDDFKQKQTSLKYFFLFLAELEVLFYV